MEKDNINGIELNENDLEKIAGGANHGGFIDNLSNLIKPAKKDDKTTAFANTTIVKESNTDIL